MRARVYIAVLALLFLICLGVFSHIRSVPDSAPPVRYSFLGYSNDLGGRQFAILSISNKDPFAIRFVSEGAYIWFDSTNTPVGASVLPLLEGTELAAGGSRTFCVEVPRSNVKRAVELWVRRASASEDLREWTHELSWRIPLSGANVYGIRSPFIIE